LCTDKQKEQGNARPYSVDLQTGLPDVIQVVLFIEWQRDKATSTFAVSLADRAVNFAGNEQDRGYLAQHPLFDQIPALAADIREPPYCVLGEGQLQSVNAWFGPPGTVRSLPLFMSVLDGNEHQVEMVMTIVVMTLEVSKATYVCAGPASVSVFVCFEWS
jgi:hypothetical protein